MDDIHRAKVAQYIAQEVKYIGIGPFRSSEYKMTFISSPGYMLPFTHLYGWYPLAFPF